MANGKIMDQNHIIGEKAVRFIQSNILPDEWVVRMLNPDYGIDMDVELFDYENGKCTTLGEHLFFQVKGTEHPRYGTFTLNEGTINVIKFQLEVSELKLVERMGSAFPVLLVLVDLVNMTAFQVCLNDYIRKVLPIQNPNYRRQSTIVINIPIENKVSNDNIDSLKWYSKRLKIYSMFHEMLNDIEDFNYKDNEELVCLGKNFIEHYRNYDILKTNNSWFGLNDIKSMLDILYENNIILDESIRFVQHVLGFTENWENGEVIECGTNAYLYAQKYSVRSLGEKIKNYSGVFETYCREWFMPGLLLGVNKD